LFPFKWENKVEGKDREETLFTERTNVATFEKLVLSGSGEKGSLGPNSNEHGFSWEKGKFELNHLNQYNEFNYYYDFVREILYQLEGGSLQSKETGKSLLRHYECRYKGESLSLDFKIHYKLKNYDESKIKNKNVYDPYDFTLPIDSITLDVYETGIAILAFFLKNFDYDKPEDILRINQYGRRLFPPFFGLDNERIGKDFDFDSEPDNLHNALESTKSKELPTKIELIHKVNDTHETLFTDDFSEYEELTKIQKGPFRLPNYIYKLFPDGVICTQEAKFDPVDSEENDDNGQIQKNNDQILIKPVLDDRMFVICWYGGMEKIGEKYSSTSSKDFFNYHHPTGKYWYQLTFVDANSPSVFNQDFFQRQLESVTYQRWAPLTYYGITRYSLVSLTSSLETLKKHYVDAAYLPQHLESIYFKMYVLAIVQRASVLRFSDEVTHISHFNSVNDAQLSEEKRTNEYELLASKVRDLNENYLRFINKIYFREVTTQEQGIEMYDMMQKQMRIEGQVKDLDQEIQELHRYVKLREQEEAEKMEAAPTNKLNILTLLGAFFILPSFIFSLYELKIYAAPMETLSGNFLFFFLLLFLFAVAGISTLLGVQRLESIRLLGKENASARRAFYWTGAATLFLILLPFLLCKNQQNRDKSKPKEIPTNTQLQQPPQIKNPTE